MSNKRVRKCAISIIKKDIALNAFQKCKIEPKEYGKVGSWFPYLKLRILPKLGCIFFSEITQTDISNIFALIWYAKANTACKALICLNLNLKHAVTLSLDFTLQAIEKAKALLLKQHHKFKNIPTMDWRDIPAFYKTLCKTTSITQLALRLLILTGICTYHTLYLLRLD
ncbi:hypothetical protein [Bartonella henselae]|uniref:hypothetical protein n=1 Tax=Bartonella henselae TaxID=38323 RepID=UPI0012D32647|nr:hypothetical protein [Bartonella henselae]MDM9996401.1 hypothetical protein [Bartonella henselae]UJM42743.1 hypothetical protein KAE73_05300 [Bartonella henselae]